MEKESQIYKKVLKVMLKWGCDLVIEYLLSIYSILGLISITIKSKFYRKFWLKKCLNQYVLKIQIEYIYKWFYQYTFDKKRMDYVIFYPLGGRDIHTVSLISIARPVFWCMLMPSQVLTGIPEKALPDWGGRRHVLYSSALLLIWCALTH